MMLSELTKVPDDALPLAEIKDHLRLGTGFTDDALQDELLKTHLRAGLATIENRTGKILLERVFEWVLFEWRDLRKQPLPLAPVKAVNAIRLVAPNGDTTNADGNWSLLQDAHRPLLVSGGAYLPTIPSTYEAHIEMIAGYGPTWADVPQDLAQGVIMLAAHFYEQRSAVDSTNTNLPRGVQSLIEPYRTVRVFMGSRT